MSEGGSLDWLAIGAFIFGIIALIGFIMGVTGNFMKDGTLQYVGLGLLGAGLAGLVVCKFMGEKKINSQIKDK